MTTFQEGVNVSSHLDRLIVKADSQKDSLHAGVRGCCDEAVGLSRGDGDTRRVLPTTHYYLAIIYMLSCVLNRPSIAETD
jgi:hypothetical protein